jgi:hypothetical protein
MEMIIMTDTKTPEQMAEEWATVGIKKWFDERSRLTGGQIMTIRDDSDYVSFLAGYEAAKPKWISVKEGLPACRVPVLCWATDYPFVLQRDEFAPGRYNWIIDNETRMVAEAIRFWMPLPDVPKEGEG